MGEKQAGRWHKIKSKLPFWVCSVKCSACGETVIGIHFLGDKEGALIAARHTQGGELCAGSGRKAHFVSILFFYSLIFSMGMKIKKIVENREKREFD